MAKKYEIPETKVPMASEPAFAVRYNSSHTHVSSLKTEEFSFDAADAPCQFTIEDVKSILLKNREDYKNGHYHTMTEVDRVMDNWC